MLLTSIFLTLSSLAFAEFTLTTPDFQDRLTEMQEFDGFGCKGKNVSPTLIWQDAPKETQSFALTMYDPDAPTGSGFWHWIVYNIGPHETKIAAGSSKAKTLPKQAVEAPGDFGHPGYGGPCPPAGQGDHTYIFTIYALKVPHLAVDKHTPQAVVRFNIIQNTLAKAELKAKFGR
jgi:Raf kinase inhibitor-like YbhB/YbcL family protein